MIVSFYQFLCPRTTVPRARGLLPACGPPAPGWRRACVPAPPPRFPGGQRPAPVRRPSSGPSSSPGRSCPSPSLSLSCFRAFGAFLSVTVVAGVSPPSAESPPDCLRRTVPDCSRSPSRRSAPVAAAPAVRAGAWCRRSVLRLSIRGFNAATACSFRAPRGIFLTDCASPRLKNASARSSSLRSVSAAAALMACSAPVVAPGPVEGVCPRSLARLKALRRRFERPLVLPTASSKRFVRIVAVAPPHAAPLGMTVVPPPRTQRARHTHYDQITYA